MEKRIKDLEIEVSYLRKELEELKDTKPIEIHTHYTYDMSNLKQMIIAYQNLLNKLNVEE